MKTKYITNDELFQRQFIVALFVGFLLSFYAVVMNMLKVEYNLLISLINFTILILTLFLAKFIVEKIYGIKFKNCIIK